MTSRANFKTICVSMTALAKPVAFARALSSGSPSAIAALFIVRHVSDKQCVQIFQMVQIVREVLNLGALSAMSNQSTDKEILFS
jgi:hypothetical protein